VGRSAAVMGGIALAAAAIFTAGPAYLRQGALAVLVPVSALFRQHERWSVFAADGGRARRVEVVPGPRNATQSVIERGLDPGVEVIVFPGDRIADGARIRVRR